MTRDEMIAACCREALAQLRPIEAAVGAGEFVRAWRICSAMSQLLARVIARTAGLQSGLAEWIGDLSNFRDATIPANLDDARRALAAQELPAALVALQGILEAIRRSSEAASSARLKESR